MYINWYSPLLLLLISRVPRTWYAVIKACTRCRQFSCLLYEITLPTSNATSTLSRNFYAFLKTYCQLMFIKINACIISAFYLQIEALTILMHLFSLCTRTLDFLRVLKLCQGVMELLQQSSANGLEQLTA